MQRESGAAGPKVALANAVVAVLLTARGGRRGEGGGGRLQVAGPEGAG